MALRQYRDEELNYFKFVSLLINEFPVALRHGFKTLWDKTIAHRSGFQLWDDSSAVRNLFFSTEGGTNRIPTHQSYMEWDCTAMFQATIFAKTFKPCHKTLFDMYVSPRAVPMGSFHASVLSPGGNDAETFALAIDQLRRLRNVLCHPTSLEINKPTFDLYIQHAKDAFRALSVSTATIDAIGNLNESDFPTSRVHELEQRIRQENQSYIKWLEGLSVDIGDIKERLESQIASKDDIKVVFEDIKEMITPILQRLEIQTSSKEDLGVLKTKIDEDVVPVLSESTNRTLEVDNAGKDDIAMSRQENEEQKIVHEDPDSKPTTSAGLDQPIQTLSVEQRTFIATHLDSKDSFGYGFWQRVAEKLGLADECRAFSSQQSPTQAFLTLYSEKQGRTVRTLVNASEEAGLTHFASEMRERFGPTQEGVYKPKTEDRRQKTKDRRPLKRFFRR